MQDIRAIQLDILRYVDSVCRRRCIRYSLSGGTLLGAVRHKGYIPWDDDIDIMLTRPEYERLIAILQISEGQSNERYKVLNCFLQNECYYTYSKLMDTSTLLNATADSSYDRRADLLGVNIDIFPIDGLPNGKRARQLYWNKMRFLKRISTMVYTKVLQEHKESVSKRIFRRAMFFVLGFFPANTVAKCVNRMAMKNDYAASEYAAVSVFGYGKKEQLPRECFDTFIEVQFEGRMYSAIAGYDKPVIIYTLEAFQSHPLVDAIEVVCLDGWQEILGAYCKQFNITKLRGICTGGATGHASIKNGLSAIASLAARKLPTMQILRV